MINIFDFNNGWNVLNEFNDSTKLVDLNQIGDLILEEEVDLGVNFIFELRIFLDQDLKLL